MKCSYLLTVVEDLDELTERTEFGYGSLFAARVGEFGYLSHHLQLSHTLRVKVMKKLRV